jgi:hypothetical protein
MFKHLQSVLMDETNCLYFVHTPVGKINVSKFSYNLPGFVTVMGEDESKQYRFLVFSEEQMRYFPLEVSRKGRKSSAKTLGFKSIVGKS